MAESFMAKLFSAIESTKRRVKSNLTDEGMAQTADVVNQKLEKLGSNDPRVLGEAIPDLIGGGVGTIGSASRVLGEDVWWKAINMVGKKASNKEIFDATKAYVGPLDNELRAIISDEGAKLKKLDPDASNLRVGDILEHPELFKYYPDLASLRLIREELPKGTSGSFNAREGILKLNKNEPESDQLLTLLHELQHGIQATEGFTSGASIQHMARSKLFMQGMSDPQTLQEIATEKLKKGDPRSVAGILAEKLYRLTGGEAEARAVERQLLNKDWKSLPTELYDVDPGKVISPN